MPEYSHLNVHFKKCEGTYADTFGKSCDAGIISTRGLKKDAKVFEEMVFDVNTAYFDRHGGYEYAKRFFSEAYKMAGNEAGGEQFIISAVMHADERNKSLSEELDRDVFHYHLHVVYIPVVEKKILWTKRCKDKSLVGTVKETVTQVSHSKKWSSERAVDENGNPVLNSNGKQALVSSYSRLQDRFFEHMKATGFDDIERGERGSTAKNLTVAEFKVEQEKQKLAALENKVESKREQLSALQQKAKTVEHIALTFSEINDMGRKNLRGKMELEPPDLENLKFLARVGLTAPAEISDLKRKLKERTDDARKWRERYEKLLAETKDFLVAVRQAPERVRAFIKNILSTVREQPEIGRVHKKAEHER